MKQIKWGLIGCGKVVENKSGPAFNTINNSSIYAVMRRNLTKAKKSAEKLNAQKYYDNIDNLLNDNEIMLYILLLLQDYIWNKLLNVVNIKNLHI